MMTENNNSLKLSVIIPVYNAEKYIAFCLSSLLNQGVNKHSVEILVIDDGSTDKSIAIVRKFQKEAPYIKIFEQENSGVSSARNKGIELAKGEYLYFIDADDYLVDNGLNMVFHSLGQVKADLVCFKSIKTREYNLNKLAKPLPSDYHFNTLDGPTYIGANGFRSEVWWYFINRKYLQNLGLKFIEGIWLEDGIFTAKILVNASAVYYVPIEIHRYVTVPTSVMNNKEPEHYKKVIYDMANAATEFDKIIKSISKNNKNVDALKKLEIRKQSYVFFLTIRVVKSKISYSELVSILKKMETIGAYPISKNFLTEYKGVQFIILRIILNNKLLLHVFYNLFHYFSRKK